MKVGKLRELLDTLPYDTKIVVSYSGNHEYREVNAVSTTALVEEDTNDIIEDHWVGDEIPEGYINRINVLLVD